MAQHTLVLVDSTHCVQVKPIHSLIETHDIVTYILGLQSHLVSLRGSVLGPLLCILFTADIIISSIC